MTTRISAIPHCGRLAQATATMQNVRRLHVLHLSPLSPYAHCALHHAVVAGMRMVSTSERKALTMTTDINKHTSSSSTDKSPEPWWDETFVGDRYLPLVYADELLVPLPGVPFLAYKHVE